MVAAITASMLFSDKTFSYRTISDNEFESGITLESDSDQIALYGEHTQATFYRTKTSLSHAKTLNRIMSENIPVGTTIFSFGADGANLSASNEKEALFLRDILTLIIERLEDLDKNNELSESLELNNPVEVDNGFA